MTENRTNTPKHGPEHSRSPFNSKKSQTANHSFSKGNEKKRSFQNSNKGSADGYHGYRKDASDGRRWDSSAKKDMHQIKRDGEFAQRKREDYHSSPATSGIRQQHADFRNRNNGFSESRKAPSRAYGTKPRDTENARSDVQRTQSTLQPRKIALEVLQDVDVRGAYAALALENRLRQSSLDRRDSAFVTRLVYGVIENRLTLDYRIDCYCEHPETLTPTVRDILRIGTYQLFFMDRVPDMAAVNETVTLARLSGFEGFTGLVNAMLRTMLREPEKVKWPSPDEDNYLSVTYSASPALCSLLESTFGREKTIELLRYRDNQMGELIRINRLRVTREEIVKMLSEDGVRIEDGLLPGTLRIYGAGNLTKTRAYENGLFSIQGENSILAARMTKAKPGQIVFDTCAAPGGKTAVISEMMQDTGRVYAYDIHPHRVELIRSMVRRMRLDNVRPQVRDASQLRPDQSQTAHAVLIDAPCTGTGVIAKKPELRYKIDKNSIDELTRLQSQILDAMADTVRVGGILVYSTCSILPEENVLQARAFLERHPEFRLDPLAPDLPKSLRPLEGEFGLQRIQGDGSQDGFYICRFVRVSVK